MDLRLRGGGAMFPMILGVKQLLSEGFIGSFRTKKKEDWFIKNNSFFIDTTLLTEVKPACNAEWSNRIRPQHAWPQKRAAVKTNINN